MKASILKSINLIFFIVSVVGLIYYFSIQDIIKIVPFLNLLILSIFLFFSSDLMSKDLFNPLSFILASFFVGFVLRSYVYINLKEFNLEFIITDYFIFFKAILVTFISFIFLWIGFFNNYINVESKIIYYSLRNTKKYSLNKLLKSTYIVFGLSILSFFLYIYLTGFSLNNITDISGKRYTFDSEFSFLGYLRRFIFFSTICLLIYFTYLLTKKYMSFFEKFYLICLIIFVLFINIYFSSRGGVLSMIIQLLVISYILGYKIKTKYLILGFSSGLFVFSFMSFFRKGQNEIDLISPIIGVISGHNLFGIVKTSIIIEAIPDKLDFQLGSTLINWLFAPIPRNIWQEKPIISIGQTIGEILFNKPEGRPGGGVPPGFFAELFWNFGYIGSFFGSYLWGVFLKYFYLYFRFNSQNFFNVVFYPTILLPVSMGLLGGDLSRTIISLAQSILPLYLIFYYAKTK